MEGQQEIVYAEVKQIIGKTGKFETYSVVLKILSGSNSA